MDDDFCKYASNDSNIDIFPIQLPNFNIHRYACMLEMPSNHYSIRGMLLYSVEIPLSHDASLLCPMLMLKYEPYWIRGGTKLWLADRIYL